MIHWMFCQELGLFWERETEREKQRTQSISTWSVTTVMGLVGSSSLV